MSDDRLNNLIGKLAAAGSERDRRIAETEARAAAAARREFEAEQLWQAKRQIIGAQIDELNNAISTTGFQLQTGDPGTFSRSQADAEFERLYVAMRPIQYHDHGLDKLVITAHKRGEVHMSFGTAHQSPVGKGLCTIEELDADVVRDWLLQFVEANVPR